MIQRYRGVILNLCRTLLFALFGSACIAGVLLHTDQLLAAYRVLALSSLLMERIASLYPLVIWLGNIRPEFLSAPGRSLERTFWVINHEAGAVVLFSLAVVLVFLPIQSWIQGEQPSLNLPWEW